MNGVNLDSVGDVTEQTMKTTVNVIRQATNVTLYIGLCILYSPFLETKVSVDAIPSKKFAAMCREVHHSLVYFCFLSHLWVQVVGSCSWRDTKIIAPSLTPSEFCERIDSYPRLCLGFFEGTLQNADKYVTYYK